MQSPSISLKPLADDFYVKRGQCLKFAAFLAVALCAYALFNLTMPSGRAFMAATLAQITMIGIALTLIKRMEDALSTFKDAQEKLAIHG